MVEKLSTDEWLLIRWLFPDKLLKLMMVKLSPKETLILSIANLDAFRL